MKFNKILIITLFLLAIFAVGAVSASENATDDLISQDSQDDSDLPVADGEGEDGYSTVTIDMESEENFEIDNDDSILIGLPEGTVGDLSVKINGSSAKLLKGTGDDDEMIYPNLNSGETTLRLDEDNEYNEYYISLDKLSPGKYGIVIDFKLTSGQTFSKSSVITLLGDQPVEEDDGDVTIDADETYIFAERSNVINIAIPESVKDAVVKIDGTTFDLTDGKYVSISKLGLGHHEIVVYYKGNSKNVSENFDVVNDIECPESLIYSSQKYISLKLAGDATGSLRVTIDNNVIGDVKLINGEAKVQIPKLCVGYHDVEAAYIGDDYSVDYYEGDIEVMPKVTYPSKIKAGDKKYLIIEVGDTSGILNITSDYDAYAYVEFDEIAKVSLANLDTGKMMVGLLYSDNNDFYDFDGEYEITVSKVPAKIAGGKNIKMKYRAKKTYSLTVYGSNAKPVKNEKITFKIGKKNYYAKTNGKGVVKFNIPKSIAPGKYTIKASFGNAAVKNKLVVKHLLKLKKVKVKKSAKKLTLKATVKKIKNKKVVFKFKGKKYVAKTNKKGVAKVTIKKNVLKKLKKGKKVKYQATYLKDTVKRTVKVKK